MVGTTLIMGITITGTVGAVHVITKAGSKAGEHSQQRAVTALAMHRMRREIGHAITVTTLTSTGIEFTHPDITGDDTDDVIAYAWSGTAGDPLTRALNHGTAQALVPECNSLVFKTQTRKRVDNAPEVTETEEVLIASHDVYPDGYSYWTGSVPVTSSTYSSETFTPTYTDATSVRFTRAKLSLKKTDWWVAGTLWVEIQSARSDNKDPTGTVLDELTTRIEDLSTSYLWEEFNFPNAVKLAVGQPYSLLSHTDQSSTYVRWESNDLDSGTLDDGTQYRSTNDDGISWYSTYSLIGDCRFFLYGVFEVPSGADSTVASGTLDVVFIHLESVEGDLVVLLDGAVECVNQPDLTGLSADALPTL